MLDNHSTEVTMELTEFAGDNVARTTGDIQHLAQTQLFAAGEKRVVEIHSQPNPSQAELLKEFQVKGPI